MPLVLPRVLQRRRTCLLAKLEGVAFSADSSVGPVDSTSNLPQGVVRHSIARCGLQGFHKHTTKAPALQHCSNIDEWFDVDLGFTAHGRACRQATWASSKARCRQAVFGMLHLQTLLGTT